MLLLKTKIDTHTLLLMFNISKVSNFYLCCTNYPVVYLLTVVYFWEFPEGFPIYLWTRMWSETTLSYF